MVQHTDSLGTGPSEEFGSPRQAKRELRAEIRELQAELRGLNKEGKEAQDAYMKLLSLRKRLEIQENRDRELRKRDYERIRSQRFDKKSAMLDRMVEKRGFLGNAAQLLNTHSPHGRLRNILHGNVNVSDIATGSHLFGKRVGDFISRGATFRAGGAAFIGAAIFKEYMDHEIEQTRAQDRALSAHYQIGRSLQIERNSQLRGSVNQLIQDERADFFETEKRKILNRVLGAHRRSTLAYGRSEEFATSEAKIKLQINDLKIKGRLITQDKIDVEKERIKRGLFSRNSEFEKFTYGKMGLTDWLAFNSYQRVTGERELRIEEAEAHAFLEVAQQRDQQRKDRDNKRKNNPAYRVAEKQRELSIASQNEFIHFQRLTDWNPN